MKTAPQEPHGAKSQPLLQRGVSWSDHDDFEFRRVEPELDPLLKGQDMRILILGAGAALFLAACDSKQEAADDRVDRLLVELEGVGPDRYVHVPVQGLKPIVRGGDTDLETSMTKADLDALPEVKLPAP